MNRPDGRLSTASYAVVFSPRGGTISGSLLFVACGIRVVRDARLLAPPIEMRSAAQGTPFRT